MRGIAYSLVALLIFSVLLSMAISQAEFFSKSESRSIGKMSSDTMASFQSAVERDLDKALDVASRRAIVTAINYVAASGTYLDDSEADLTALTLNGTLNGTDQLIMQNNSLEAWAGNVDGKAGQLGLAFSIEFDSLNVTLEDSFNIRFDLSSNMTLTDKLGISGFNRRATASVVVPIDGFEDPLYTINTDARVLRAIHRVNSPPTALSYGTGSLSSGHQHGYAVISPGGAGTDSILVCANASEESLSGFVGVVSECSDGCISGVSVPYVAGVSDATTNIASGEPLYLDSDSDGVYGMSGFFDMVSNGYYNSSLAGPTFLDKLEGNVINTYGIGKGLESFVNLLELSANEITIKSGQDVLDYLYFDNYTYPAATIRGVSDDSDDPYYPWFKLGNWTAENYGVSGLMD